MIHSGDFALLIRQVTDGALHAYRDQQIEAMRFAAATYDRENWLHDCWRRFRGHARHALETPIAAEPVLNIWRLAPHPSLGTGPQVEIVDPTQRTLRRLIERITPNSKWYQ